MNTGPYLNTATMDSQGLFLAGFSKKTGRWVDCEFPLRQGLGIYSFFQREPTTSPGQTNRSKLQKSPPFRWTTKFRIFYEPELRGPVVAVRNQGQIEV